MKTIWIVAAAFILVSAPSAAQGTSPGRSPAADSVYRRAMTLVNDGETARGRALLDSMVTATRAGSLEHAEALYWRAAVAPSAAEAERDYQRVILDHPLSPRIPDALLRLAQLELARGNREGALRHLQRLDLEYPNIPARARTSYWTARAYLDQNDLVRGCAAVGEARARASAGDIELRNQIEFIAQRCPALDTQAATVPVPAPSGVATQPPVVTPAPPRDTRPSIPVTRPAASETEPVSAGPWSVQVGAYNRKPPADALAQRLRARGYQARVDGTVAPFRVRIGRYPTRAAAAAALRRMEGQGMEGFIARTDVR